jgi:cytochrome c oxidase cbb3-type subunit 3
MNVHAATDDEPMAHDAADTDHSYDGIREHDNKLPRWWLFTLYAAVIFAYGYWIFFHTTGVGLGPRAAYERDYAAFVLEQRALAEQRQGDLSDESLWAARKDGDTITRGKAVYDASCLACHGANGEGLVGPNLTDDAFVHGARPLEVMKVINEGVAAKGMPSWGPVLGATKVRDVTVFLLTLRGKNLPGKAAEGVPAVAAATPPS